MQRAWNKYSEENFEFTILEECKTNLNEKEIEYIKFYDTYKNGYNNTIGGEGTIGRICSIETKKKISKANKGNHPSNLNKLKEINHTNKKTILQINTDGQIIKKWDDELQIRKELHICTRSIRGCCKFEPKRYTYKNFIWVYEDIYNSKNFNLNYYLKHKIKKEILQFSLDDIFIREWNNIREASKTLNINETMISFCCKGKRKQSGGYIWRYKYNEEGRECTYRIKVK